MIIFWFICAMMILMALWFVLPALWQTATNHRLEDAQVANTLVYQDHLREMEADLKAGLLSEAQYERDKEELERRLLEDIGDSQSKSVLKQIRSRALAYAIAVALPLAAVLFYFVVGNPKAVEPGTAPPPMIRTR